MRVVRAKQDDYKKGHCNCGAWRAWVNIERETFSRDPEIQKPQLSLVERSRKRSILSPNPAIAIMTKLIFE
jgi:hypothetical protein